MPEILVTGALYSVCIESRILSFFVTIETWNLLELHLKFDILKKTLRWKLKHIGKKPAPPSSQYIIESITNNGILGILRGKIISLVIFQRKERMISKGILFPVI